MFHSSKIVLLLSIISLVLLSGCAKKPKTPIEKNCCQPTNCCQPVKMTPKKCCTPKINYCEQKIDKKIIHKKTNCCKCMPVKTCCNK